MPLKPETSLRKKIDALERHKAMADALIRFIKAHPGITAEATLHQLHGKVGLSFPDYALIVPTWKGGEVVLRLVKSGEDWINDKGPDDYYAMDKLVLENVSGISDDELEAVLGRLYLESHPDEDEVENEDEG